MRKKKKHEIDVFIDDWSDGGHGLGKFETTQGAVAEVEVPFSVPGDHYRVQLLRKRGGVYQSWPLERTKDSNDRIQPRCSHFATCGGCRWQQIDYPHQLRIKDQQIASLFRDIPLSDASKFSIVACDPPFEYRNKMEFSFSQNTQGELFVGLYMSRGKVFNLTECHLVTPWFSNALALTRTWALENAIPAYHPPSDRGSLRTLTVREGKRTNDRMVFLTLSGNPDFALSHTQLQSWVQAMTDALTPKGSGQLSVFIRIQQLQKGQPTQFFEMHLAGPDCIREQLEIRGTSGRTHSLEFQISPSAFFQPNTLQAEKLYSLALSLANVTSNSVVYDLYCGTGTLGICLAPEVRQVFGIELSREAALDARENCKRNGIQNYEILTGDVGKILSEQVSHLPRPDLVLLDPPRAGLDALALHHLSRLLPPTIVYISCNPKTQAPNVAALVDTGYRVEAIQPVDQFPHTPHVENIVTLKYYGS